jgi:prevent-host-death family protein
MTTTEMSTRETRDHFADRLEAARRGEATLITSRGRPVAALVPAELLDEYERLAEAEDLRLIDERISRYESGGTTTPLSEVLAETLARR